MEKEGDSSGVSCCGSGRTLSFAVRRLLFVPIVSGVRTDKEEDTVKDREEPISFFFSLSLTIFRLSSSSSIEEGKEGIVVDVHAAAP